MTYDSFLRTIATFKDEIHSFKEKNTHVNISLYIFQQQLVYYRLDKAKSIQETQFYRGLHQPKRCLFE